MNKVSLALAAMMSVPCLFAVDGVVLINQSTVTAAGGFPYVISQPGSYKLSGNLTVPAVDGIHITTSNVVLDLNGFTISCAGSPIFYVRCIDSNTNNIGNTANNITIRNGTIAEIPVPGGLIEAVHMGTNSVLADIVISLDDNLPHAAMEILAGSIVRKVIISNPAGGNTVFFLGCPSLVSESVSFIPFNGGSACLIANSIGF